MNFFSRMFTTAVVFLQEVKTELKKTSFPDRNATTRNTIAVIVFSIAVAMFLGGLDMLFAYLLNRFVF
ncbi:preprotein translocase subunit SecE [Candidatus Azambacteria bacterium]|nr:preprotein translocase subunit SecE [Candidatus Azambacteria bacterium]MBI3685376.1 preprotein translocase subunit SecE [Candidatus Azambacteria bacterium]